MRPLPIPIIRTENDGSVGGGADSKVAPQSGRDEIRAGAGGMLMPASSKKKTIRSRLRQMSRRLLPRTWVLRAAIRRSDRYYRPRVALAKGDDRKQLVQEHMEERASLEEQLAGIQTRRLLRRAWRYYIVAPEIPWSSEDREDSNWIRGWASDTWHLKAAAVASLERQIQEAKKRRLETWEAWAKILGGLLTLLIALVSALVSLTLAWRR